ncbi:hypothetical protein Poli38472_014649 [Pythium oligandrum]|uniref:Protein kinase domain-containing protein n=1 Tax=Pythium oligandrum TaxID=41045 RepID=A0A8K1FK93_PYTOL|nr:hypothetical protein Poli38472_014649 [Pythium oligandrum]|eukprot:TMW63944.1 hypothetical protein Poli38472_014649 [Pythium oligandrum]
MGNQTSAPASPVDASPQSARTDEESAHTPGGGICASSTSAMETLSQWFTPPTSATASASSSPKDRKTPTNSTNTHVRDDGASQDAEIAAAVTVNRRVEHFYDVSTQNLGRGHYAVVCRGKCRRTGQLVAIKKIKRFLTDEKRLRAEIAVLRRVQKHPNIVELIDVFETAREVHLVLELCTGGELFERLADKGPYSEADCVRHIRDMACAVQYLHEQGIVHRDLKPENILLSTPNDDEAVIKVADFGLAKIFTGTNMKTKCGTWGYSAPEMISGSGITFGYDYKVDSWSLGTILYILLCGFHPFDPNGTYSDHEMIACIKNCRYDFKDEVWDTISDGARDLIGHLLVLDPDQRYSMAELLRHPWITGELVAVSALPLSPTIHRDLARYRQQEKQKAFSFEMFDDDDDNQND